VHPARSMTVKAKTAADAATGTGPVTCDVFIGYPMLFGGTVPGSTTTATLTATTGELSILNQTTSAISVGDIVEVVQDIGGFWKIAAVAAGSSCKIFRAPAIGIAAATWDEMADELTVTSAQCQEYAWNSGGTKLQPVTLSGSPVTYSVANPFRGRVPGSICIPTGFTEDAEVCEDDPLPEVPELDPPCDYDVRVMEPFFFMAVKNGPHYIPSDPLMPTKRVHVLQRPQLHEDEYGVRTLQFPLYEVRLPVPIHDGCEPLPFAVCGPAGAAVPCE